MPFANYNLSQGTLNAARKEKIIHKTSDLFTGYPGEGARPSTLVPIDDLVDGGDRHADKVFTLAKRHSQEASS